MSDKPRIIYPIVVEGRYDRARILDVFDADCISTDGFGIFNKEETVATICALAKKSKLIILTDSDGAGNVIRKRIAQAIPKECMINLYTPQIKGKEKRKKHESKQGYLGVEGMDREIIMKLLSPFTTEGKKNEDRISKLDLYLDGLSGGQNSQEKRDKLADQFSLPKNMNANALLSALYYIASKEEYKNAIASVKD